MAKVYCPACVKKTKMVEIKKGLYVCPVCKKEVKKEDER